MGFAFDLNVQEIQQRMDKGACEVTGYPLDLTPLASRYERRPNSPSLDRINPKNGYTMDNVRVVCLAVNMAMGTWGAGAFLPIAVAWTKKGNH
jgi:hypothetical protein